MFLLNEDPKIELWLVWNQVTLKATSFNIVALYLREYYCPLHFKRELQ